jgi:hypothetical protein
LGELEPRPDIHIDDHCGDLSDFDFAELLGHLIMCRSEARLVDDGQGFAISKGGLFGFAIERALSS